MKIAVLFDGAGLARLGLEQAGHDCTGFELNPVAHHLSTFVGSGNCMLADVRNVDLSAFEAVWASPPCQERSGARRMGRTTKSPKPYSEDLFDWACALPHAVLWVENVRTPGCHSLWNAAQFDPLHRQNRNRVVYGRYPIPRVLAAYKRRFVGACPAVLATDYEKGPRAKQNGSASRFLGHKVTLEELAWLQGLEIPAGWREPLPGYDSPKRWRWRCEIARAIGNGVPVYMARAFGEAAARLEAAA